MIKKWLSWIINLKSSNRCISCIGWYCYLYIWSVWIENTCSHVHKVESNNVIIYPYFIWWHWVKIPLFVYWRKALWYDIRIINLRRESLLNHIIIIIDNQSSRFGNHLTNFSSVFTWPKYGTIRKFFSGIHHQALCISYTINWVISNFLYCKTIFAFLYLFLKHKIVFICGPWKIIISENWSQQS